MWMHFYFSDTGKHRIYFQIYSFVFLFYIFHLKCSSFLTRKIKSAKFKESLGYFSLIILSKVFHIPFYLQLHFGNPSVGNRKKQTPEEGI